MGMYTELHFNAELKKDVPSDIVAVLEYMMNPINKPNNLPDHPFFHTDRWDALFVMDSYYFSADTHSTLRYDDISNSYYLCIRSNIKNYHDEIGKFIDWIRPYLDEGDNNFLGFYRYEETETPTLIYMSTNHEQADGIKADQHTLPD